ncbi:MAG: VanZ family protein [Planctomycetes bacterium]|nr:VanZ family protein [Planctomycetota bacterium]MBU1518354.1 VanZ family protein [Planctomycetota bacterium]MBU2596800.1 VanZ family protein [Planctomycetota bacterium]
MNLSKERKFFTIVLIFYWVGIFFATHIPVPGWTRKMGVSDKTMHFAAYLVLMLLLWLSVSFEKKADWKKIRPWLLMGIVAVYGLFDEVSQYFIEGRSADLYDLLGNFLGAAIAMILVTIMAGRHTAMIPFVICPMFLPGLVRSKLIAQSSIIETAVYAAAFAIITIAWAQYLSSVHKLNLKQLKHIPAFFAGLAGTIAIVKIYAVFTNKPMGKTAILSAFAAIILTLIIWSLAREKRTTV